MVSAICDVTFELPPKHTSIREATKEIRKTWTSGERLYRALCAQRLQQQLWESLKMVETPVS